MKQKILQTGSACRAGGNCGKCGKHCDEENLIATAAKGLEESLLFVEGGRTAVILRADSHAEFEAEAYFNDSKGVGDVSRIIQNRV